MTTATDEAAVETPLTDAPAAFLAARRPAVITEACIPGWVRAARLRGEL